MAELRWILLGLGMLAIGAIWWWTARRSAQAPGNAELRESTAAPVRTLRRRADRRILDSPRSAPHAIEHARLGRTALGAAQHPHRRFERVPALDRPMMARRRAARCAPWISSRHGRSTPTPAPLRGRRAPVRRSRCADRRRPTRSRRRRRRSRRSRPLRGRRADCERRGEPGEQRPLGRGRAAGPEHERAAEDRDHSRVCGRRGALVGSGVDGGARGARPGLRPVPGLSPQAQRRPQHLLCRQPDRARHLRYRRGWPTRNFAA